MTQIEERVHDVETERLIDIKHHHSKGKWPNQSEGVEIRRREGKASSCHGAPLREAEVMRLMSDSMSVLSGRATL